MREQGWDRSRAGFLINRRLVFAIGIFVAAGLLLFLFLGRHFQIRKLRLDLASLDTAHATALEDQDALRDRLASADDAGTIEALARERLGLVMPGEEKVIFLEEPQP